jgi:hypothetical protein
MRKKVYVLSARNGKCSASIAVANLSQRKPTLSRRPALMWRHAPLERCLRSSFKGQGGQ